MSLTWGHWGCYLSSMVDLSQRLSETQIPKPKLHWEDKCAKDVFQPQGELSTPSLAWPLEVWRFGSPTEISMNSLSFCMWWYVWAIPRVLSCISMALRKNLSQFIAPDLKANPPRESNQELFHQMQKTSVFSRIAFKNIAHLQHVYQALTKESNHLFSATFERFAGLAPSALLPS